MVGSEKTWYGPIGLANSRYAPVTRRREVEALLATHPELRAQQDAQSAVATLEQIAVAQQAERDSSDALKLAQAQKEAIEQEAARHTQEVEHTMYHISSATVQTLNLIRYTIRKECPDTAENSLKTIDHLWAELQKLFQVIKKAKEAVPRFMEKDKENAGLFVAAKVQEAHKDYQQVLKRNEKRVELLHDQNVAQLQAFRDVEAAHDLKNADLQERLTRTALELGLLRDELESTKRQLASSKSAECDVAKLVEKLQKEVDVLNKSMASLTADNDRLHGALKDAEAKLKLSEEKVTECEKVKQEVSQKLEKQQHKSTAVDTELKALRQTNDAVKNNLEKMKSEHKLISDKYKNQTGAFAKVSEDLKEQSKKTGTLQDELLKLQQQTAEIGKERDRVKFLKDSLQNQHEALKQAHTTEIAGLKDQYAREQGKARELSEKIERGKKEFDELEKDNEELELENNDLRAQLMQYNGIGGNIKKADAEIGETDGITGLLDCSDNPATLRNTIENMKVQAPATGNTVEVADLQGELENMKEKLAQVETERDRWAKLGRKAMEQFREAQQENEKYQAKFGGPPSGDDEEGVKFNGSPSGGSAEEVKFWRDKYDALLSATEG